MITLKLWITFPRVWKSATYPFYFSVHSWQFCALMTFEHLTLRFLNHVLSGKIFLEFKAELEEVYKIYCQNHDDAISLLESYEKDENIQRHVLQCLERLRWVTTANIVWKRRNPFFFFIIYSSTVSVFDFKLSLHVSDEYICIFGCVCVRNQKVETRKL